MLTKENLEQIFNKVLNEINPYNLIENQNEIDINSLPNNITLLGSGKAVLSMAQAIHKKYQKKIKNTVLVGAYPNDTHIKNLTYIQSTHPLPSIQSLQGAKALINTLKSLNQDDFFIYLLSGGNSSLVELPLENITLEDFQKTTDLMIKGAMPIEKINCVRKHISQVKGGKLAKYTKAKGIVFVLSDVLGNNLKAIGSAPLYYDNTSLKDACSYLKEYNLFDMIPLSVQTILSSKSTEETPKKESKNITHFLVGSNTILLEKTKKILIDLYIPHLLQTKSINNDVHKIATFLANEIKKYKNETICLLYGGEATVHVTGEGKGGRNQHLALLMIEKIAKYDDVILLSCATDGIDGNSKAAGAIIDNNSLQLSKEKSIDLQKYKNNFDSNTFFQKLGGLVETKPTHNNILDIIMIVINSKKIKNIKEI